MHKRYSQNDPDAYSYSGGLNRTNQGLLEFVEMFKAPIKVLYPLLTATQESNYIGTESMGALPFDGIVLAHSNEAEWQQFKANKNNEAFLDRICVVKVPYCLRVSEETKIYEKLLGSSELGDSQCAPETLAILAQFGVLTRLRAHENSNLYSKMRVYDGENLKDTDPKAKSPQEYRDAAGVDEGMTGISTRFAFKVLSETFNYDNEEVAADPVHLMYVLDRLCTSFRPDQHVVGEGLGAHGDAEQRAEGGVACPAPVEAEHELVEIALQVLGAQPVIDAARPALEIGEHLMDPGQHEVGGHGTDDVGIVGLDGGRGVAGPAVGLGGAGGGDVVADEAVEAFGAVGRDLGQAQAARRVAVADLDGADDEQLAVVAAPGAAGHGIILGAERQRGLVDLDEARQRVALGKRSTMALRSLAASSQALR